MNLESEAMSSDRGPSLQNSLVSFLCPASLAVPQKQQDRLFHRAGWAWRKQHTFGTRQVLNESSLAVWSALFTVTGKDFLWQIDCHVVFLHTWPNLDETALVLYSLTAPRIPILMVWILQLQKLWSLKIRRQQLGTWQKQDRLLRLSLCNAFSSTNGGHTTSLISIWYFQEKRNKPLQMACSDHMCSFYMWSNRNKGLNQLTISFSVLAEEEARGLGCPQVSPNWRMIFLCCSQSHLGHC